MTDNLALAMATLACLESDNYSTVIACLDEFLKLDTVSDKVHLRYAYAEQIERFIEVEYSRFREGSRTLEWIIANWYGLTFDEKYTFSVKSF